MGLGVGGAPGVDVSEKEAEAKHDGPPWGETGVSIACKENVLLSPVHAFTVAAIEITWEPGRNGFDVNEPRKLLPSPPDRSVMFTGT